MKIKLWVFILVLPLLMYSCWNNQDEESVEAVPVADSGIVLSKKAMELAGITFGVIDLKELSHDVSARGQITLLPENIAIASVMMEGTIQSINVSFGQQVRKGETLATYSHPDIIGLQQKFLETKAMLELKKNSFNRQKTLWNDQVSSDKEFQQAKQEYYQAQTEYSAIKSKLEMLNIDVADLNEGKVFQIISVVSPIAGYVEEINVSMGQYVGMENPLFKIIDKTNPVLQLKVFEKDIHFVEKDQRVTFASPSSQIEDFEARIFSIGAIVDQNARVIDIMAKIKGDPAGLIPGMFVSSTIHTREQFLKALPESAIVVENENKKYGFYTLDKPGMEIFHFYPFEVNAGFEEEGYIEVAPVKPLPEEARIVLSGVYYLKSEMMKSLEE